MQHLPDSLMLSVFKFLDHKSIEKSSQVSKKWFRVARDGELWKSRLYADFPPPKSLQIATRAHYWREQYLKFTYDAPRSLQQSIKAHSDLVSNLSLSDCGKFLASTSKDGTLKLWQWVKSRFWLTDTFDFKPLGWWLGASYVKFNENSRFLLAKIRQEERQKAVIFKICMQKTGCAQLRLKCEIASSDISAEYCWHDKTHVLFSIYSVCSDGSFKIETYLTRDVNRLGAKVDFDAYVLLNEFHTDKRNLRVIKADRTKQIFWLIYANFPDGKLIFKRIKSVSAESADFACLLRSSSTDEEPIISEQTADHVINLHDQIYGMVQNGAHIRILLLPYTSETERQGKRASSVTIVTIDLEDMKIHSHLQYPGDLLVSGTDLVGLDSCNDWLTACGHLWSTDLRCVVGRSIADSCVTAAAFSADAQCLIKGLQNGSVQIFVSRRFFNR